MAIADTLLPEFDHEMRITRALLERVPEAQAAWKPHPKSFSLGDLSAHLSNLPTWATAVLQHTEFDMEDPAAGGYVPRWESKGSMLDAFDRSVTNARGALAGASDAHLMVFWTLKNGGHTVFSLPRAAVLRSSVFNHMIHHRGQLSVYLRLHDVPLPAMYGPSADSAM